MELAINTSSKPQATGAVHLQKSNAQTAVLRLIKIIDVLLEKKPLLP